jgi:hypothetical protein
LVCVFLKLCYNTDMGRAESLGSARFFSASGDSADAAAENALISVSLT